MGLSTMNKESFCTFQLFQTQVIWLKKIGESRAFNILKSSLRHYLRTVCEIWWNFEWKQYHKYRLFWVWKIREAKFETVRASYFHVNASRKTFFGLPNEI